MSGFYSRVCQFFLDDTFWERKITWYKLKMNACGKKNGFHCSQSYWEDERKWEFSCVSRIKLLAKWNLSTNEGKKRERRYFRTNHKTKINYGAVLPLCLVSTRDSLQCSCRRCCCFSSFFFVFSLSFSASFLSVSLSLSLCTKFRLSCNRAMSSQNERELHFCLYIRLFVFSAIRVISFVTPRLRRKRLWNCFKTWCPHPIH